MKHDMARDLTWAAYDGGEFGTGYVLCRSSLIMRVLLPARTESEAARNLKSAAAHDPNGFAGEYARRLSRAFSHGEDVRDLPFALERKATPFNERVRRLCHEIPRGAVVTYGELAKEAGNPKATRAVGNFMAQNPHPLIIPCHRVLGSGHKLHNYGGGLEMKRHLLQLEGALQPSLLTS
jgi:methylated-DNA-[protein]-cysteine S-methyltransferase